MCKIIIIFSKKEKKKTRPTRVLGLKKELPPHAYRHAEGGIHAAWSCALSVYFRCQTIVFLCTCVTSEGSVVFPPPTSLNFLPPLSSPITVPPKYPFTPFPFPFPSLPHTNILKVTLHVSPMYERIFRTSVACDCFVFLVQPPPPPVIVGIRTSTLVILMHNKEERLLQHNFSSRSH